MFSHRYCTRRNYVQTWRHVLKNILLTWWRNNLKSFIVLTTQRDVRGAAQLHRSLEHVLDCLIMYFAMKECGCRLYRLFNFHYLWRIHMQIKVTNNVLTRSMSSFHWTAVQYVIIICCRHRKVEHKLSLLLGIKQNYTNLLRHICSAESSWAHWNKALTKFCIICLFH